MFLFSTEGSNFGAEAMAPTGPTIAAELELSGPATPETQPLSEDREHSDEEFLQKVRFADIACILDCSF